MLNLITNILQPQSISMFLGNIFGIPASVSEIESRLQPLITRNVAFLMSSGDVIEGVLSSVSDGIATVVESGTLSPVTEQTTSFVLLDEVLSFSVLS